MDNIPLPPGFTCLQAASQSLAKEEAINIIGVVVDYLPPAPTRGIDLMLTLGLQDQSYHMHSNATVGIRARFFSKIERLPRITEGVGDIIIMRNIRGMFFKGTRMLISTWSTQTMVYPGSLLPEPSFKAAAHSNQIKRFPVPSNHDVTAEEQAYVIALRKWAASNLDLSAANIRPAQGLSTPLPFPGLPNGVKVEDVAKLKTQLLPPKDKKYQLLEKIKNGGFYDLVGEVRKIYYDKNGLSSDIYLTDYTTNNLFYQYSRHTGNDSRGQIGDEFGYSAPKSHDWPGPFGRQTLQIRAWEPHHSFLNAHIVEGDYVRCQNVKITFYNNQYLQGVMHGDQTFKDQVNITKLKHNNERVREVKERRETYWRQEEEFVTADQAAAAVGKRQKLSKGQKKRKREREEQERAEQGTAKVQKLIDVNDRDGRETQFHTNTSELPKVANATKTNPYVICGHPDQRLLQLPDIINTPFRTNHNQSELPFINMKMRCRVRIVDFYPSNLEDFTQSLNDSSFNDIEQDVSYEGSSAMDLSMESGWEWAFYLMVEDAKPMLTAGEKPLRLPLLVHGKDAEHLLKLDAVDLRQDPSSVAKLREKLFILWGNLEEVKTAGEVDNPETKLSSTPFECCISEYGVKKLDDGYCTRVHRMFKTTIR